MSNSVKRNSSDFVVLRVERYERDKYRAKMAYTREVNNKREGETRTWTVEETGDLLRYLENHLVVGDRTGPDIRAIEKNAPSKSKVGYIELKRALARKISLNGNKKAKLSDYTEVLNIALGDDELTNYIIVYNGLLDIIDDHGERGPLLDIEQAKEYFPQRDTHISVDDDDAEDTLNEATGGMQSEETEVENMDLENDNIFDDQDFISDILGDDSFLDITGMAFGDEPKFEDIEEQDLQDDLNDTEETKAEYVDAEGTEGQEGVAGLVEDNQGMGFVEEPEVSELTEDGAEPIRDGISHVGTDDLGEHTNLDSQDVETFFDDDLSDIDVNDIKDSCIGEEYEKCNNSDDYEEYEKYDISDDYNEYDNPDDSYTEEVPDGIGQEHEDETDEDNEVAGTTELSDKEYILQELEVMYNESGRTYKSLWLQKLASAIHGVEDDAGVLGAIRSGVANFDEKTMQSLNKYLYELCGGKPLPYAFDESPIYARVLGRLRYVIYATQYAHKGVYRVVADVIERDYIVDMRYPEHEPEINRLRSLVDDKWGLMLGFTSPDLEFNDMQIPDISDDREEQGGIEVQELPELPELPEEDDEGYRDLSEDDEIVEDETEEIPETVEDSEEPVIEGPVIDETVSEGAEDIEPEPIVESMEDGAEERRPITDYLPEPLPMTAFPQVKGAGDMSDPTQHFMDKPRKERKKRGILGKIFGLILILLVILTLCAGGLALYITYNNNIDLRKELISLREEHRVLKSDYNTLDEEAGDKLEQLDTLSEREDTLIEEIVKASNDGDYNSVIKLYNAYYKKSGGAPEYIQTAYERAVQKTSKK